MQATDREQKQPLKAVSAFVQKHRAFLQLFTLNLVLTLVASLFLIIRMHYAADSYTHIFGTTETFDFGTHLSRAGFTAGVLRGAQLLLGFNLVFDQRLFYLIMVIATALSITFISRLFLSQLKQPRSLHGFAINAACIIAFVNPFIYEFMLYPECAIFVAAGNLLTAAAVCAINKKGWKRFALALLCIILVLAIYQAYLGVYFALASSLLWFQQRGSSRLSTFFVAWLRIFFVGLIAAALQVAFMKFYSLLFVDGGSYGTVSLTTDGVISNTLSLLTSQLYYLKWALGDKLMIPFAVALLILLVLLVLTMRNLPMRQWITFAFALITSYCSVFIIHTIATDFWVPFRSIFGVWSVIAVFLIIPILVFTAPGGLADSSDALTVSKESSRRTRLYSGLSTTLSVLMLVAVCVVLWDISLDNYKTNEADDAIARGISLKLTEYEEETGIKVTHFTTTRDEVPMYVYPDTRYVPYESSVSARGIPWSLTPLVNHVSGRSLKTTTIPEEVYDEYFAGKDWGALDLESQLVIVGNSAYYCSY